MDFVTIKLYKIMNLYLQLTTKSNIPYYEYKNNGVHLVPPPLAHIFSRLV